jgi:acyl-CoA thioester hydrolase
MISNQHKLDTHQYLARLKNFSWSIRVYFEDTDAGGIVYYANYLKFVERARTEWLRTHGLEQNTLSRDENLFFVVRKTSADYFKPARLDDTLEVSVSVERLGQVAVEFYQEIRRNDEVLVECHTKVACVSAKTLRPVAIPSHIRQNLLK